MTIDKVMRVLMSAFNSVVEMLDTCVISINGAVDISIAEILIGIVIAFFIVKIAAAFAWGG